MGVSVAAQGGVQSQFFFSRRKSMIRHNTDDRASTARFFRRRSYYADVPVNPLQAGVGFRAVRPVSMLFVIQTAEGRHLKLVIAQYYDAANHASCQESGSVAQGETGIIGMMMESFLVDGRQDLKDPRRLVYGQSITDACMGWEMTLPVLQELAAAVRARRGGKR